MWYIPFLSHVKFLIIFHRCFPILLAYDMSWSVTIIRFEKTKIISRKRRVMKCDQRSWVISLHRKHGNQRTTTLKEFILLKIVSLFAIRYTDSWHFFCEEQEDEEKHNRLIHLFRNVNFTLFRGTFRLENQNSMYKQMKRQICRTYEISEFFEITKYCPF